MDKWILSKILKNITLFVCFLLPFPLSSNEMSIMQNSEWMESVQLILGEWMEGSTDIATENLQLSRVFSTVERSSRHLAEGWQFNLPDLIEQEIPRKRFLHPLKENIDLTYDEAKRLTKIATRPPYPYEAIDIFYEENPHPCCKAVTHLGETVEYSMQKLEGNTLYLTSVKKAGSPEVRYRYQPHPYERKLLIVEREVEGVEKVLFTYTKEGKLHSVYRNNFSQLLFSLEYLPSKTKVFFPTGVELHYTFTPSHEITKMETWIPYQEGIKLYRTLSFQWNKGRLSKKATFNSLGEPLIQEEFSYDDLGRLLKETLIGTLSSHLMAPTECYSKEYVYDQEGRLVEEREESGKIRKLIYKDKTPLILESTILDQKAILEHSHFSYSPLGKLELEIQDFGSEKKKTFKNSHYDENGRETQKTKGFLNPYTHEMEIEELEFYEYDLHGRVTKHQILDALENCLQSQEFHYDGAGKCVLSTRNEETTSFAFTPNGRLLRKTEQDKNFSKISEYRQDGKLIREEVFHNGHLPSSIVYCYDSQERLIKKIDQNGNENEFVYDPLGRKIAEISPWVRDESGNPIRLTTKFVYDELDRLIEIEDASGFKTRTQYNSRGQPLAVQHPDGTAEYFEYTLDGRIAKTKSKEGLVTLQTRDLHDQLLLEIKQDARGNEIERAEYVYSGTQLIQERHSQGNRKTYSYDYRGKKIREYEKENSLKTSYEYNSLGEMTVKRLKWEDNAVSSIWDNEEKRWLLKDEEGQILLSQKKESVEDRILHETMIWDASGLPLRQEEFQDSRGVLCREAWDALGRMVLEEKLSPLGKVLLRRELFYDALGHLTKEKTSKGPANVPCETVWSWGPCGRLEKVIEKFGSPHQEETNYLYDTLGRMTAICKPDGTLLEQTFDEAGRLATLRSSDGSVGYSFYYNSKGLIEKVVNEINQTTHVRNYNDRGDLILETLENGSTLSYEYDSLGRKTRVTLPDRSFIRYDYDLCFLKRVRRFDHKAKLLYEHTYAKYDQEGKPIEQEIAGGLGIIRDEPHRRVSPYHEETFYCDAQNRIVKKLKGNQVYSYSYNELSEVQQEEGPIAETYGNTYSGHLEFDLNGNLTKKILDKEIYEFEYDALNRLTKCYCSGDLVAEYSYDAYHRRMECRSQSDSTLYFYDGNCEIGAIDRSGKIKELRILGLVKGSERDATIAVELDSVPYVALNDTQGSLCKLVDFSGKMVFEADYNTFGKPYVNIAYVDCPWSYSGKRLDKETGLLFYGRRYLDPGSRLWISKDPLGFIDGADRRAFVNNDPLNQYDHFGLSSFSERFSEWKSTLKKWLQQAGVKLLHSIKKLRDYCTMDLPQTLDHLIGKGFLLLMGYYKTDPDQGSYGKGEVSDKVRVSFINGILTDYASLYSTLQELSNSHGGVNIHYVYRPTRGWIWDIVQSFMVKIGFISPHAHALAKEWKKMIFEMGGVEGGGSIFHYAHSIGAVETVRALSLLTPEEQKMIQVYTFGSPSLTKATGNASIKHFISVRDGVPWLDPWGFFKACKGSVDHVLFVGSFIGIPIIDHLFNAQTYQDLWRSMGKTFVDWYGFAIAS